MANLIPRTVLFLGLVLSSSRSVSEIPLNIPPTLEGYIKVTEDKFLGPIWYRLVAAEPRMTLGTVKLTFAVPAAGGRVEKIKVTFNNAGSVDQEVALKAVRRLRAPPVPAGLLRPPEVSVPFEESFTVFQNPAPGALPARPR